MSSAVLLDDVEAALPDEELPPYQDVPEEASRALAASYENPNDGTWALYRCVFSSPLRPFNTDRFAAPHQNFYSPVTI